MKLVKKTIGVFLVMLYSATAYAVVQPSVKDTYDSGCVVDFSTEGCFTNDEPTSTAWKGPVTTACKANRNYNQACRRCKFAYDDNGQYKGYSVCAYVAQQAECFCKNANTASCISEGACDYVW
jgi:hypothetical protein